MQEFTTRPELCGSFGAVASTHWIGSAVGMRLLEAGHTAFDAAVAAGFVLQVLEPHMNGPGGDATILCCRSGSPEPIAICGQGPAPAAATIERFKELDLDLIPGTGLLAACVPGAFGAWLTLLRDFGTASLRDVFEPAIFYAEQGHPILGPTVDAIASVRFLFTEEWKSSAKVYLRDGEPPAAGSLFSNADMGATFRRLLDYAESAGSSRDRQIEAALSYWYDGPIAEQIDRFCHQTAAMDVSGRRHRGLLTADDMKGWRPPIETPLHIDHGDFTLFKCGAWSQGPALLQALQILKGTDISAHPPESPEYVHLVVEALKLALADRDAWYGDEPNVPINFLLSNEYASVRRNLIASTASLKLRPGDVQGRIAQLPTVPSSQNPAKYVAGGGEPTLAEQRHLTSVLQHATQKGDTCHLDVVDRWGNMVAATPSGGWLQSSPIIPTLGFPLGTRMQMFWLQPDTPNGLRPFKRPRTTLTPSLAFKNGKPYMAFGTPGGDQQEQWSIQLWIAHVVHGRSLQRAIETAAFHTNHAISSFWPRGSALGSLVLERRYTAATIENLQRRGHNIELTDAWSEGRLSACTFEQTGGRHIVRAGANPRGMQGYAIAR